MLEDMSEGQLGWMAGVLDSDGSLMILTEKRKTLYYLARITVTNTDKRMLNTILSWTGLGTIIEHKQPKENWAPCWSWHCQTNAGILLVLLKVLPYLVIKKEQARTLIQFCALKLARKCDNPERLYLEMKRLKKAYKEVHKE